MQQPKGRVCPWEKGGAIVEFMIVIPLFLGLAIAVWEFGRIIDAQLVATNAAREGARYVATHYDVVQDDVNDLEAKARSRVMQYLQDGYGVRLGNVGSEFCTDGDVCLSNDDIQVAFVDDVGQPVAPGPGKVMHISVTMKVNVFQTFIPGLADLTTLTGRANMRL